MGNKGTSTSIAIRNKKYEIIKILDKMHLEKLFKSKMNQIISFTQ